MPVTTTIDPLYPADRRSPSRLSSPAQIRAQTPKLQSTATDLENISKELDGIIHFLKTPAVATNNIELTSAEIAAAGTLSNDTTGTARPTGAAGGDLVGTYPNPSLKNKGPGAGTYVVGAKLTPGGVNGLITLDAQGRVVAITPAT